MPQRTTQPLNSDVVHGNTAATPSVFSWWTFLPIPLLSILNFYILRAALKTLRWIYKSNLRLPIFFYVVSMVIFFFWYNWTLFYHFYCAIFQYFFPLFLFSFLVSQCTGVFYLFSTLLLPASLEIRQSPLVVSFRCLHAQLADPIRVPAQQVVCPPPEEDQDLRTCQLQILDIQRPHPFPLAMPPVTTPPPPQTSHYFNHHLFTDTANLQDQLDHFILITASCNSVFPLDFLI